MVLPKRLDCRFNGYQVPPVPHVPKSAKGKRSVRRKKTMENRMCAIDLLAAVAGKLLLEGEGSLGSIKMTGLCNACNLNVKHVEMKPNFYRRKICYARQRTQRSLFKRRKFFQRCSISASVGGGNNRVNRVSSANNGNMSPYEREDFHVKLSIKSFKVPELFIEIPENSTVASLKRTVMEAVTAILEGGLCIGVLVQGKKVRDDSKTLLQAGISHDDQMDDLGFTLEPNSSQAPTTLANPEKCHLLSPCDFAEPLARFPSMVPASDGMNFDVCPKSPLTPIMNCPESDHDSLHSPSYTLSLDKNTANARALIAIPSMNVETPPMTPVRKPRRSELVQRRIRRPFSVSEVEALVEAVEKLGSGRWRDVKIRAFDNAKHRTYVDLKAT